MVVSKLLRAVGILGLLVLAAVAYIGYRLYTAFKEHGEFGWAVSDPESEP